MGTTSYYGAVLERGEVMEAANGKYRVESLTRIGITTPPLPALQGLSAQVGDRVYFYLFDDGTGILIAKLD